MITTFAGAVQQKLREDLNALADSMANGSAGDYAEYQHMVGQIHGLAIAERHLMDAVDAANRAEAGDE